MSAATDLEKGLSNLKSISYDSIDKLMRKIAKDNDISPTELHHKFKDKHKLIPDDWVKQMKEGWSDKYKKSIDCDNPKGFSQKAHCQGKKKKMNEEGLRDWFGKSKSKDGKSGWVNVVTGGTCASDEPGEGTPKCVSSAKRASMTPAERKSAQRRKKAADPGQQQKTGAAKPTYVSTDKPVKKEEKDHEVSMAQSQLDNTIKDAKKLKSKLGKKEKDLPAWMQAKITDTEHNMDATSSYVGEEKDKPGKSSGKKDACYHKVKSRYDVWPSAYASGALVKCRKKGAKNWGNSSKNEEFMKLPEFSDLQIKAMESSGIQVEVLDEAAFRNQYGKKGQLSQSSRRKSLGRGSSIKDGSKPTGYESPKEFRSAEKKFAEEIEKVDEACWKGYTQKGMKKKGNKVVPNCVPVGEEKIEESTRVPAQNGNVYLVGFTWKGKYMMMRLFFPEVKRPSREDVQSALNKVYPGCFVQRFDLTEYQPSEPTLNVGVKEGSELKYCPKCKKLETRSDCAYGGSYWDSNAKEVSTNEDGSMEVSEGAAWTRKEGQNKEGGLNEKGRKSYEAENPGSDLKAPSKKVGNKRRASFCARMKGMKKKLTSKKTASDPDSRINKSLRAWNC
jgi:hypothetical protein